MPQELLSPDEFMARYYDPFKALHNLLRNVVIHTGNYTVAEFDSKALMVRETVDDFNDTLDLNLCRGASCYIQRHILLRIYCRCLITSRRQTY